MRRGPGRRRAVSEMLSAIILIAIVMVVFAAAVYPLYLRYQAVSQSAASAVSRSAQSAGVGISLTYWTATPVSGGTQVTLYLYSYGTSPFTPSEVVTYVAGNTYALGGGQFQLSVDGNAASTIPPDSPAVLTYTVPYTGAWPSSFSVTLIGSGTAITLTPGG